MLKTHPADFTGLVRVSYLRRHRKLGWVREISMVTTTAMYLDAAPAVVAEEVDGRREVRQDREAQQEVQLHRVDLLGRQQHLQSDQTVASGS